MTAGRAIGYAQALAQLSGTMSRGRRDRRDAGAHAPLRAPPGVVVQAVRRRRVGRAGSGCRSPGRLVRVSFEHPRLRRADTDAVIALWQAAGLTRPWNDPHQDIERKLTVQPELFLVAVDGDEVVGLGHGRLRRAPRLALLPRDRRRRGVARASRRALVTAAEARLDAMGCPKVQLMVRPDNEACARLLRRARLRAVRHLGDRQAAHRRRADERRPRATRPRLGTCRRPSPSRRVTAPATTS